MLADRFGQLNDRTLFYSIYPSSAGDAGEITEHTRTAAHIEDDVARLHSFQDGFQKAARSHTVFQH